MSDALPSEILLVRHGETPWSRTGVFAGRTDIPLTPEGEEQAAAVGRHLAAESFDHVWASPMLRARETCRIAGFLDRAAFDDDLRERSYGAFEGRTLADIRAEYPEWSQWTAQGPEGESLDDVAQRAERVANRLAQTPGRVVVFAHGHLLRVLTATWLRLPPLTGRYLALRTGAVCRLGWEGGVRVIHSWNLVP